jgi:hypothetical protein
VSKLLLHINRRPIYVAVVGPQATHRRQLVNEIADALRRSHDIRPTIARTVANRIVASGGPSGLTGLDLIDDCQQALQRAFEGPDPVCLSDFWIGEPLVALEQGHGRDSLTSIWNAWQKVPTALRWPHLLLTPDPADGQRPEEEQSAANHPAAATLELLKRSLVFETSPVPTLPTPAGTRVDGDVDGDVVADAIAAILAMM